MNIKSLLTVLRNRLEADRVNGSAAFTGDAPATAEPVAGKDADHFPKSLKAALTGASRHAVGTVQLLALGSIKAHFGDRWEEVAPKIHAVIRSVIGRAILPRDAFTCFQDQYYVIVFAGLKRQGAEVKTALIAQEILLRIFGDGKDAPSLRAGSIMVEDGKIVDCVLREPEEILTALAVSELESVTPVDLKPPEEAKPKAARQEPFGQDAPALREMETALLKPEINWIPLREEEVDIPADLRFIYAPAWLPLRRWIAAYSCRPARLDGDGCLLVGGKAMPEARPGPTNLKLDLVALRKVVRDLESMPEHARGAVIVLPMHLQTLSRPKLRAEFLAIAGNIHMELRQHLLLEIIGVTDATPPTTLMAGISALRPFCRDILVRTRLEARILRLLRGMQVKSVGVDLSNLPLQEAETFRRMNLFNTRARKTRLTTFAHGVPTRSLLSGAVGAGFRYLDGAAVALADLNPSPVRPWTAQDIYAPLLAQNFLKAGQKQ